MFRYDYEWLFYISIFVFLIILYIFNRKISKKLFWGIIVIIIIAYLILCFKMVPPKSFDLYRYFIDLDHYRNMNFNESIIDIFSRPNFIWYIIMRIIALLFTDNRCIFLLTIPVTIGIFAYILYKISYNFKLSNRQIVLSILCFFSIISTVHLMSGIRNALAFSLFSLGFYLNNLESKKTGYWFYILSFFIHPMIIIPLFFTFLGKYISKIKYIEFGLLIWKPAAWIILLLIELIPISLFQLYATKLKIELTYVFGIDIRIFLFELLQMIIITILMLIIHKVKKENINSIEAKNTTIFYYLSFFIIGSITMNNIFIRTRFMFAYFIPYILAISNTQNISNFKFKNTNFKPIIEHSLLVISIIIQIYYIYYIMSNANYA